MYASCTRPRDLRHADRQPGQAEQISPAAQVMRFDISTCQTFHGGLITDTDSQTVVTDDRCETVLAPACRRTRMTSAIPTRFSDDELVLIDELVAQGVGPNRSAVIRRGLHELADAQWRVRTGEKIASVLPERTLSPQMTTTSPWPMRVRSPEAEPWRTSTS